MLKAVKPVRAHQKNKKAVREENWPDQTPWLGADETGFFCAPRSLGHLLLLLKDKTFRKSKHDPRQTYIDLLSRHWVEGIVEMAAEGDHVFASGFSSGESGLRAWRECMADLESLGLIKIANKGHRKYGTVLLVHPTVVIQRLRDAGRITDAWWNAYREFQLDQRENRYEDIESRVVSRSTGTGKRRA